MWWVKDWVCIMQEELKGCLGVVFSVLVAVARGPHYKTGTALYAVWRFPGESTRETPTHPGTGKPSAPNLENGQE